MSDPRVTVLTATYNGHRFLAATLESVLAQTFTDFEYIVVDDASTDNSTAIVEEFARQDRRIRLIRNAVNQNPAGALNVGLAQARGEYVAILDHDDITLPHRLAEEVAFLDDHPGIGAVGGQVQVIDERGATKQVFNYPTDPHSARWMLYFGASISHSAALYRRRLMVEIGGYSVKHPYLCDYELLMRLAERTRITNLPTVQSFYRQNDSQVSHNHRAPQAGQALLLQFAMARRWLGIQLALADFQILRNWLLTRRAPDDVDLATRAIDLMDSMTHRHLEITGLTADEAPGLYITLGQRWLVLAHSLYRPQRALARQCWCKALDLDAEMMTRPQSWKNLRRDRTARAEAAEPTPNQVNAKISDQ